MYTPHLFTRLSAALALAWCGTASAAGTWQTTLEGVDLDLSKPGFEAYYDKTLNITWLADVGAVKNSPFAAHYGTDIAPLAFWFDALSWLAQLQVGGVSGWRLPSQAEFQSMYFTTLGHTSNVLAETGPFLNFGTYRPNNDWVGAYLWTSTVVGGTPTNPLIRTFGIDGYGWNFAAPGNPNIAWAVHDGKLESVTGQMGRVDWALPPYQLECKNNTTGQVVTLKKYKRIIFNCAQQGLVSSPGDSITISVTGTRK